MSEGESVRADGRCATEDQSVADRLQSAPATRLALGGSSKTSSFSSWELSHYGSNVTCYSVVLHVLDMLARYSSRITTITLSRTYTDSFAGHGRRPWTDTRAASSCSG